ncbi:MAG: response regulator [Trueperaceae bacterium]|nr:MAG: response regulator [Trueperaceae bacterium]
MANQFKHATIMIIDDAEVDLLLLERILQNAGYSNLYSSTNPRQATELLRSLKPDLVCTDLHMPNMGGLEVIDAINAQVPPGNYLPVVVLTADLTPEAEQEALRRGARDFLNKPFNRTQIELRIHNLLQTRFLHLELQRQNERLEQKVLERTIDLELARQESLEKLALAAEYRDYTTGQHTQRVGTLSGLIARKLGLPSKDVELISRAAPLHDVGKIGIPDDILLKPGKLTEDEFRIVKTHIDVGVQLLAKGHSMLMKLAQEIVSTHHERWDGSGYPLGLKGDHIPVAGQIVAVADVFDALINERPYKPAWPLEKAITEIMNLSGSWFSPRIIQAFLQVLAEQDNFLTELKRGINTTFQTMSA